MRFPKKRFNLAALPILSAIVMLGLFLATFQTAPVAADTIDLLGGGDFSSGMGAWWTTPSITPSTAGGELEAVITAGGANPWDAIVGHHDVVVQAGETYTLSLTARASTDVTVNVILQENGGSFATYFSTPLALTTSDQDFTFTFSPSSDDPAATFQFHMGGLGEFTTYFDDIVLLGPEAPPPPPPTTVGELLVNGDFENGFAPWWTSNVSPNTGTGELEAVITNGGVNVYDAIVGQHGVSVVAGGAYSLTLEARADTDVTITVLLQQNGGAFTQYFSSPLALTTSPQTFEFYFTGSEDNPAASFQFHMGGQGEFTVFLDDISLQGPVAAPEEDTSKLVRLNQTGYVPTAPKRAAIVDESTDPLAWTLYDADDTAVANGTTTIFGDDSASGDHVHMADFSNFTTEGEGYYLDVNGELSHPFDISSDIYSVMRYEALAYFYHNRSGIALTMPYAGSEEYTRDAGHIGIAPNQGDYGVPCFDQNDTFGNPYEGCNYTLDVVGGWYDAGDHGKYVVNGGISVWTMLNQYERTLHTPGADASAYADGSMNIPENNNGVPDILDEARWQLEFLMSMQVPAGGIVEGELREGMIHHKIHDVSWTGLGLEPADDDRARYLYPPSTAATLNVTAVAAQCARLYASIDSAFAADCLAVAESTWDAAVANPAVYAGNNFTGGGPYNDNDVSDEFYWAAAELFITTGATEYLDAITASGDYLDIANSGASVATGSSMDWQETGAMGTISLAMVPNSLPAADVAQARANIISAANGYIAAQNGEGYLTPFNAGGGYPWGSNSFVVNNMIVISLAYDFTNGDIYLDAVQEGMDYILGRNAMDQSYVSGYGERPLLNPHHRFWAIQLDDSFPRVPAGVMSGGPNSGIEDPYAQGVFTDGCVPQKCFIDHIESWSTNEITINWNAPFAWLTAFLDENADAAPAYYVSPSDGSRLGSTTYNSDDVLAYDVNSGSWSLYMDGSDVGLPAIDALEVLADGTMLMSLAQSGSLDGVGAVESADIVRFWPSSLGANTSGSFTLFFDGSDAGLSSSGENVDAIGFDGNGRLVVSISGSGNVPADGGGSMQVGNEQLIAHTSSGWELFFDGRDVGLQPGNIGGTWIDSNDDVYLSVDSRFYLDGIVGDGNDILLCPPVSLGSNTDCTFEMFFDGSATGLRNMAITGFSINP